jgi:hypothetical protein
LQWASASSGWIPASPNALVEAASLADLSDQDVPNPAWSHSDLTRPRFGGTVDDREYRQEERNQHRPYDLHRMRCEVRVFSTDLCS